MIKSAFLLLALLIIPTPATACNCADSFTQPAYTNALTVAVAYGVEIEPNHWRYQDSMLTIHAWFTSEVAGRMVVRWQGEVVVVWEWEPKQESECRFVPGNWQSYLEAMVF